MPSSIPINVSTHSRLYLLDADYTLRRIQISIICVILYTPIGSSLAHFAHYGCRIASSTKSFY